MVEVKELYEQLCLRVPVKQYDAEPADFRGVLQRELKEYMFLMNWVRQEGLLTDENVAEVGRICKKLNDIMTSIYQGLHSGYLEKRLNDENLFPVYPIDDK